MSDDIVKLAALRQQRRPKTERPGEATLFDGRYEKEEEGNTAVKESSDPLLVSVETIRSRCGSRKRLSGDSDFHEVIESCTTKVPLPFVKCKIADTEADVIALLSTASQQSLISRELFCKLGSGSSPEGRRKVYKGVLSLGGVLIKVKLEVQDDIPDVVLGIDFLTKFKCEMNFKDKTLLIGDQLDLPLPFIPETEIPLKFKVHRNVAASF